MICQRSVLTLIRPPCFCCMLPPLLFVLFCESRVSISFSRSPCRRKPLGQNNSRALRRSQRDILDNAGHDPPATSLIPPPASPEELTSMSNLYGNLHSAYVGDVEVSMWLLNSLRRRSGSASCSPELHLQDRTNNRSSATKNVYHEHVILRLSHLTRAGFGKNEKLKEI